MNKTARWTFYTAGVIFIILGFFSVFLPMVVLVSTAIFMGVGFLLAGLNNLIPYFTMRGNPLRPAWLLPLGVIDIVFGVFFLSHIWLVIFTVTMMLGIWVLLAGCVRVYISLKMKKAGIGKWWLMMINSSLMLVLSGILLSNPRAEGLVLALLTGLSLIGAGVLMITEGRMIYPADKEN